jgi:glycosyltransferase involved in cell wall biosynthesis
MKKILFVVHRYAPYPGGSENYVRDMAEECKRRGHLVSVFAGEHKGPLNGVYVTSNQQVLMDKWDLIVVHGGDVGWQNFVLLNAKNIVSPVLFMLIRPSYSETYMKSIPFCKYLGCSTIEDWEFLKDVGYEYKSVVVRHGIDPTWSKAPAKTNFREKYNITTKHMLISSGGFWPNKAHKELVELFQKVDRDDMTLVITGYDDRHGLQDTLRGYTNVRVLMLDDRQEVLDGIAAADLYLMHSHSEGFGLVLLESMFNHTPWAARNIAGAKLLNGYGFTYDNDEQLVEYLKHFEGSTINELGHNYKYVTSNHLIKNTVDDILELV